MYRACFASILSLVWPGRTLTAASMAQAGKHARRDLLHAFSEDALDAAGARRECPPFAVIASTTMELSVGKCGPRHLHPWPSALS